MLAYMSYINIGLSTLSILIALLIIRSARASASALAIATEMKNLAGAIVLALILCAEMGASIVLLSVGTYGLNTTVRVLL